MVDSRLKKAHQEEGWIRLITPSITRPSLQDNTGDADRLGRSIEKALHTGQVSIDLPLIRKLPSLLRKSDYRVSVVVYKSGSSWHLIDIWPASPGHRIYGLAVDLGTTTLVTRLMDLSSGKIVKETSFINPQTEIGPDILTRIHHASQRGGLAKLQKLVVERLNRQVEDLTRSKGFEAGAIVAASVAGNTTMTHLFLGLDPYWICREPYIPAINKVPVLKASEVGVKIHPDAPLLVFPNVGGYFGGDLIAGILASGMTQREDLSILMDIGTNAEIVLGNKDWLMACAGAAGPALEGGVAGMGMMAGPGVIDKVTTDSSTGEFQVRTIDDKPPAGICGSGLIDLVAQLYLTGMIDVRGKYTRERCGNRLKEIEGMMCYVLVPSEKSATGKDLALSQPDIDALLRSKAAMYTILTTVSHMANVSMRDIKDFFVAGTFGSYIDPQSAITIGMVPDLPPGTYKPLGNTSVTGASMALLSEKAREEIYEIRNKVTYVELNVNQEFMNFFSAARFIPHTDRSLFPSVRPNG
jgi:uncharacterized 2Fe-2S/4Fe-4S cluster protein (DUF4445 family)